MLPSSPLVVAFSQFSARSPRPSLLSSTISKDRSADAVLIIEHWPVHLLELFSSSSFSSRNRRRSPWPNASTVAPFCSIVPRGHSSRQLTAAWCSSSVSVKHEVTRDWPREEFSQEPFVKVFSLSSVYRLAEFDRDKATDRTSRLLRRCKCVVKLPRSRNYASDLRRLREVDCRDWRDDFDHWNGIEDEWCPEHWSKNQSDLQWRWEDLAREEHRREERATNEPERTKSAVGSVRVVLRSHIRRSSIRCTANDRKKEEVFSEQWKCVPFGAILDRAITKITLSVRWDFAFFDQIYDDSWTRRWIMLASYTLIVKDAVEGVHARILVSVHPSLSSALNATGNGLSSLLLWHRIRWPFRIPHWTGIVSVRRTF